MQFYLKHNLSWEALVDLMILLTEFPYNKYKFPSTKYRIMEALPFIGYKEYANCTTCDRIVDISSGDKICPNCNTPLEIEGHFIYINMQPQITIQINKHWDAIHNLVSRSENITDVSDGRLFTRESVNWLPLKLNTDGFRVYNSNKNSVWPILLQQDYLPPNIRFLKENIITAGLYFGKKPDLQKYLAPLVAEARSLHSSGICIKKNDETHTFYPNIISCSADLPAKYMLSNMTQHNSYFGCTYCLHPGELVQISKTKMVRYPLLSQAPPLRTESETHQLIRLAENEKKNQKGVKGVPAVIGIPGFNIIDGFNSDYLHNLCTGTMRYMDSLWTDSKNNSEPFYISKHNQRMLSERLESIQPCKFISRKPRSISDFAIFKAVELRNQIIYFLYPCAEDIISEKYLNHFLLLSSSVYSLLSTNLTAHELQCIHADLIQFVKDFETFYGKKHCVMNMHLLTHLVQNVINWGPLWAQSTFVFEHMNGVLGKYVRGTRYPIHQIASKYILSLMIDKNGIEPSKEKAVNRCPKQYRLTAEEKTLLCPKFFQSENIQIHTRSKLGKEFYTSMEHKKLKTADYYIEFEDVDAVNQLGSIKYYFTKDDVEYCLIDKYRVLKMTHQYKYVESSGELLVMETSSIKKKLIHIQFISSSKRTEICIERPNPYEME